MKSDLFIIYQLLIGFDEESCQDDANRAWRKMSTTEEDDFNK